MVTEKFSSRKFVKEYDFQVIMLPVADIFVRYIEIKVEIRCVSNILTIDKQF